MHKKFRSCSRLLYSHPHLRCFSKLREFKSRNAANTLQNTESSKVLFKIPKYKFGHTSQTCNSVWLWFSVNRLVSSLWQKNPLWDPSSVNAPENKVIKKKTCHNHSTYPNGPCSHLIWSCSKEVFQLQCCIAGLYYFGQNTGNTQRSHDGAVPRSSSWYSCNMLC